MTPDQFALAWESTGVDRFPYPLAVQLSARTVAERAGQQPALDAWRAATVDADLEVALRILAEPSMRVEVFGFAGSDGSMPVRMLGAAVGRTAAVAAQHADGNLAVALGTVASLPECVVSGLPTVDPGTEPQRSAPLADVRRDSKDVVLRSASTKSVAGQIRRTLNAPRAGIGQILVTSGLDLGVQRPTYVLSWIDIVEDGRYVVRTRRDVDLIPASNAAFADQLRRVVTEAGS